MKITTKDIIAYLPLDPDFKKEFEEKLDTLDPDRRLEIVDNLWLAFDELFELKFQENLRSAIERVSSSEEEVGADFYKKIRQETRKEIEKEITEKSTTHNLSAIREKLKNIISQTESSLKSTKAEN